MRIAVTTPVMLINERKGVAGEGEGEGEEVGGVPFADDGASDNHTFAVEPVFEPLAAPKAVATVPTRPTTSGRESTCYLCHHMGHLPADCPNHPLYGQPLLPAGLKQVATSSEMEDYMQLHEWRFKSDIRAENSGLAVAMAGRCARG